MFFPQKMLLGQSANLSAGSRRAVFGRESELVGLAALSRLKGSERQQGPRCGFFDSPVTRVLLSWDLLKKLGLRMG